MDRALLEIQLAEAEKNVQLHSGYVNKQRELVAQLEAKAMEWRSAREQLEVFEKACAAYTSRRDQLLMELAASPGSAL